MNESSVTSGGGSFLSRHGKLFYMSILVIAVGAVVYLLLKKSEGAEIPVAETATVGVSDAGIYGDYEGRIRACQSVEIQARVEGFLESMLFAEGAYIRKGQTLFVIDPILYEANVKKAQALLNKAKTAEDKARRDLERIRPLYEENAASRLDLDNAVAAYESAKADVTVCEAEVIQAELSLGYTSVKSPISGYISDCSVNVGTLVGPGGKSHLATVVNSDTVLIDFSMPSIDYQRSKIHDVSQHDSLCVRDRYVTVILADGSAYPYRGIVDFADSKADPDSGTVSIRAKMPNPDNMLLPGETINVRLLVYVKGDAMSVPETAVEVEDGKAYVYVVRPDNVAERREVEVGPRLRSADSVIVESGLEAGESIVVDGGRSVRHGMKVSPVGTADKAAD